jgi:hypothetical protein
MAMNGPLPGTHYPLFKKGGIAVRHELGESLVAPMIERARGADGHKKHRRLSGRRTKMKTNCKVIDERRVYRTIAFPVSAFDALQVLKRAWRLQTNGEVLTRVLLDAAQRNMENGERVRDNCKTSEILL